MGQALWAVDHVELALMPRLLGVAGSTLRLLIQLDEAEHAIYAGLEIAQQRGDRAMVAKLLQRLAYVIAERSDRARALRISERVTVMYGRASLTLALVEGVKSRIEDERQRDRKMWQKLKSYG